MDSLKSFFPLIICLHFFTSYTVAQTGTTSYGTDAGTQGDYNTNIGFSAGKVNAADYNTFIGAQAGQNNTTGAQQVFLGLNAGKKKYDWGSKYVSWCLCR